MINNFNILIYNLGKIGDKERNSLIHKLFHTSIQFDKAIAKYKASIDTLFTDVQGVAQPELIKLKDDILRKTCRLQLDHNQIITESIEGTQEEKELDEVVKFLNPSSKYPQLTSKKTKLEISVIDVLSRHKEKLTEKPQIFEVEKFAAQIGGKGLDKYMSLTEESKSEEEVPESGSKKTDEEAESKIPSHQTQGSSAEKKVKKLMLKEINLYENVKKISKFISRGKRIYHKIDDEEDSYKVAAEIVSLIKANKTLPDENQFADALVSLNIQSLDENYYKELFKDIHKAKLNY